MKTKSALEQKMEEFRSSINRQSGSHSDWHYIEDSIEHNGTLFTAMSREYCEDSHETAYSEVYSLSNPDQHPQRLYYDKFWDSSVSRDASVFIKKLAVIQKGEKHVLIGEAEDGRKHLLTELK